MTVTIRNIGQGTLSGVTATASSTTTGATFPAPGPTATFADIAPGSLGTVHIPIALASSFTGHSVVVKADVNGTVGTGGTAAQSNTVTALRISTRCPGRIPTPSERWTRTGASWSRPTPSSRRRARSGRGYGNSNSDDGTSFQGVTNVQADESIVTPPSKSR